jgi:hypothetical protein
VKFEVKPALLMGGRLALFHYSFSQVSEITFSVLFPAGKGDRFVFMGKDISKVSSPNNSSNSIQNTLFLTVFNLL